MKRQRTEERKGVAPPPSFNRRQRRRKWKNLINEIIPQSTSIRLHSAGALHTRRQAARQAGGRVCIQSIEKITEWIRVFLVSLVITKVKAGPSLFSASIIAAEVGPPLHRSGR